LAEAEAICNQLLAANAGDAAALQLLGMVQHRLGRLDAAQALFARSVEIVPRNAEFRMNLALLLAARGDFQHSIAELERALALEPRLRPARLALARISNQTARYEAADAHARKLIAANDNDSEAWSALGTARFALQRVAEARDAFERAVALVPDYGAARYGLAAVLCAQERAEEALVQAAEAARLGVDHRELVLTRARACMQLDRYDEAESTLTTQLSKQPHDVESQFLLAQLRQVRGDADCARGFREAAARPDAPPEILVGYGDVARRVGDCALSERLMRELIERHGRAPAWLSSLGTVLHEQGRHGEAVELTREAALAQPLDATIAENFIAAALSAGAPREALPTIERFHASAPDDQRWITYRIDAARQLGEELFAQWCDFRQLVRAYDLPAPAGYASMDEFNAQLEATLARRHVQSSHPLDQSMRHGTQTSRGLVRGMDRTIDALLDSLAAPIADYQQALGCDPTHPLLARNTSPARLVGCWSVRLKRGGFHVNHIHPAGWLSSAYYVSVPAEADDAGARSGWIKFGEPRFPQPGGDPQHFVQPRAGRLVLFPSYMWHGTVPIQGEEPRLTIAFDAVPGAA
jgi:tetratricopeptide (TPR) repeat protein